MLGSVGLIEQYGDWVTWRAKQVDIEIDMPCRLIRWCNSRHEAQRDIAYQEMLSVLRPQLDQLTNNALVNFVGNNGFPMDRDTAYLIVLMDACDELKNLYPADEPALVIETNGMVFDERESQCQISHQKTMSDIAVFVQCVDLNSGNTKRYWGISHSPSLREEILKIMMRGAKWPTFL